VNIHSNQVDEQACNVRFLGSIYLCNCALKANVILWCLMDWGKKSMD